MRLQYDDIQKILAYLSCCPYEEVTFVYYLLPYFPYRTAPCSTASHCTSAYTSLTAQLLFTFSNSNIQNGQNDPGPDGGCDWKFQVDEDGLMKPNVIS